MAKGRGGKRLTIVEIILHRKLKIEEPEPPKKEMNSGATCNTRKHMFHAHIVHVK